MQLVTKEATKDGMLPSMMHTDDSGAHVSIFFPMSDSIEALRIKFTGLVNEAKRLMKDSESEDAIEDQMTVMWGAFREYQERDDIKGFAIFKSKSTFFHTSLSTTPPELVVVASSFHLKPLLHCIALSKKCYALSISARFLKVYQVCADQVSLQKIYSNDLVDKEHRKGFIGQRKRSKEFMDRFVKEAAKSLVRRFDLRSKDVAILGPRALRQKLKSEIVSKCRTNIVFESTMFSSLNEMAEKLTSAVNQELFEGSQRFVEKLVNGQTNSLLTRSLKEIAVAAVEGRIEKLVVDPRMQIWGLYDRDQGLVSTHSTQTSQIDDCVIDDISEEVLKRGGEVIFFDSTSLEKVAPYMAILRW